MKYYIPLTCNPDIATHLLIETYYDLGGRNVWTGAEQKRGYYLRITPVTRENKYGCTMESFTAFTGAKVLLKSVSRQSKKAEREAEQIAELNVAKFARMVCDANGIETPAEFTETGELWK